MPRAVALQDARTYRDAVKADGRGFALVGAAIVLFGACSPAPTPSPTRAPEASRATPAATASALPAVASLSLSAAGTFPGAGLWAIHGATLLISVDAGMDWRRTAMPPPDSYGMLASFVLDEQRAWSITRGPGSTDFSGASTDVLNLVVHRTVDGGASWQGVNVGSYPGTSPEVAFIDPQHGFILISPMRHSSGVSTTLATDDGGATWTVAGTGPWLGPLFTASDESTLWAGAQQDPSPIEHPLLEVSRDGGLTWVDVQLPGLVGALGGGNRWLVGPPRFIDRWTGLVTIASVDPAGNPQTRIFRSTDSGISWTTVTDRPGQAGANPATLDSNHWILPVVNPFGLIATANAGASWGALQADGLASPWIDWIDVVDPSHLAALILTGNGDPGPEALFLSTDGGRTWKPADPGSPPG